jgi:hypothetical protein
MKLATTAKRLVIYHFITPSNLIPIESVLRLQKVWTRLQIPTRNRASIRLGTIAAINVLANYSSRMSTGMPNLVHLHGRVDLGLLCHFRLGQSPLQSLRQCQSENMALGLGRLESLFKSCQIISAQLEALFITQLTARPTSGD